jgi:acetyl-CoA carboxylase biotin carboxyl carrier protein
MFKLSEIKELLKLVDQISVQELEIENEGSRLVIRKQKNTETVLVQSAPAQQLHPVHAIQSHPAPHSAALGTPAAPPAPVAESEIPAASNLVPIVSPMVGTFYLANAPGAAQYVNLGDKVNPRSVVCIIEAMKLMNEIEAEVSGEVVEILVDNGQLVEYGQPLFLVKPL